MARNQPVYVCSSCGGESLKWQGQCPHCSEWNTLTRVLGVRAPSNATATAGVAAIPVALATDAPAETRMNLGMSELDRVFGGGIGAGSVSLLGGEPGIGKSTLLLQVAAAIGAGAARAVRVGRGIDAADHAARAAARVGRTGTHAAQRQFARIDHGVEHRAARCVAGRRFDPDDADQRPPSRARARRSSCANAPRRWCASRSRAAPR